MNDLVTIAIPFYNAESTLALSVKSVLYQSYRNLEIILIDDGSTDRSLEIAKSFLTDSRVKVISDGLNKGLISRLNQIIDNARGNFIARMDADDLMDKIRIEKQVQYFNDHPECDLLGTGMISINKNLEPIGKRNCDSENVNLFELFKNGANIIHPSIMVKTTWFKSNRYAEGFERAEDRELFTRTIKSSIFKVIPEPLFYYRDVQNMNLKKYLISYRTERKVLLTNGKDSLPTLFLAKLYCRSLIKSIIIRIYFYLRIEDRLFEKKTRKLEENELLRYIENLKALKSI